MKAIAFSENPKRRLELTTDIFTVLATK